ncbi:Cysteine-rich repeat secretory protein 55 [Apostasia shenzhenica]|uniref:Cysteine-rich repeat secretory protein 55 n=1 Tax=Apostasia shenzhenica TaxID=1088818 RepID=A0A2I0BHH5_9ASPA|nr:Cysteine-rich repeat secretory protein 55 [Apostasia shenzhenica]
MAFSHHLLFLALLLLFLPLSLSSSAGTIYSCKSNFTNNDALQADIDRVVSDLVAGTQQNLYAKSAFGAVYGHAMCRGDVSQENCSTCMAEAAHMVRQDCHDSADSSIWSENVYCFLHYGTSNFSGTANTTYVTGFRTSGTGNPAAFDVAARQLMIWVNAMAVFSSNKFGTSFTMFESDQKIYGMALCTPDLSGSACEECLGVAMRTVVSMCAGFKGCAYIFQSCMVRYDTYVFTSNVATLPQCPFCEAATTAASVPAPSGQ